MSTAQVGKVHIHPVRHGVRGEVRIPHSKPHMQRAVLLSLLANAPSVIVNPAWSSESRDLFEAAKLFGADVVHEDEARLVVTGTGRSAGPPATPVTTAGSAFNFRTLAAVACLIPGETVIEGNASMRARPVTRYLNFITDLGARWDDVSDATHLRIKVRGGSRLAGETLIDPRHSSQALTAALLVAPLADGEVRIRYDGEPVGEGYVDLTLAMMREQGAAVERSGPSFLVTPSAYRSQVHLIASDFTALSYVAGAVAVVRDADVTVAGYRPSGLSSEKEFMEVLGALGVHCRHDPVARTLRLRHTGPAAASVEIDGRNMPTVVPTLAAIAPFVDAKVTVRDVAHVNNHKCPRVSVMLTELGRLGCQLTPLHRADGLLDGFTTTGRQSPPGGVAVDGHGDHRIFMSLATAALGCRMGAVVDGAHLLPASFPGYLDVLTRLGVHWDPSGRQHLEPVPTATKALM
ncbi:hypothetical protein [Sphaerisporangium rubeum]|uniref:3-phosphoshikimate 1-carboxyvinyltransferase n=1 Tax=Sphaerisporangium rubeum TaxID=321317 RepID=A0A7X0I8T5_9ACTN|nr:3-phosphoshikimate 1-carboxyvinyltransferase [Sphaerisporangium rubeum]